MKLRISLVAALAATLALATSPRSTCAQSRSTGIYNNNVRLAQQNVAAEQLPSGMGSGQVPTSPAPPHQGGTSYQGDVGYMSGPYMPGGCVDGSCYGGCDQGCCQSGCSGGCCDSGGHGGIGHLFGSGGGQFFFTADYLYVRPSFSEATAFVRQDLVEGTDTFVPLEFDYESSYRFGGGYRSCCCGDQIRFMFTRMGGEASDTAFPGDIVPYEAAPPPDGFTEIDADVDAKTFDLECAKTIPLGGQCCGCGDACGGGCGDCCGSCCPAWDLTWSGGVRWADVGWNRSYVAFDEDEFAVTDARVGMVFHGGGLRTGLEGRRYFFKDGWLSVFGKGNISLLLGDVHIQSVRAVDDPSSAPSPDIVNTQNYRTRQIIPVTELEGGVTAQVSCSTAITLGYMFAAWHDLGFRDEFELNTLLPLTYDDANILGFDGLFARVEFGY
jgi:hypothetical protein